MTLPRSAPAHGPDLPAIAGLPLAAKLALVAVVYALATRFALTFSDGKTPMAAVWPAGGVALAALLLSPRRQHAAILATILSVRLAANLWADRPLLISGGFMLANALESVGCAWVFHRLCDAKPVTFARTNAVHALAVCVLVVNGLTAAIGATFGSLATGAPLLELYVKWWTSNGLGLLTITPLILACTERWQWPARSWMQSIELAALAAVWCATAWIGLKGSAGFPLFVPHPYWIFVPLTWVALRFGPRTTTVLLTVLVVIGIGLAETKEGAMPLGGSNPFERLRMVQLFLGVAILTGMTLAAAIAERRHSAEDLVRSEARYVLTERAVNDGLWECNLLTDEFQCSPRWEQILGYTPREFPRTYPSFFALIHPDDQPRVHAALRSHLEEHQPYMLEFRTRHKDGSYRWILSRGEAFRDAAGRPVRLLGAITDVTARRRIQQEKDDAYRLNQAILSAASLGICVYKATGEAAIANEAAARLVGLAVPELLKQNFRTDESWRESTFLAAAERALATGIEQVTEDRLVTKLGRPAWVVGRFVPFEHSGEPHLLLLTDDISDRHHAEAALRESEARFRAMINYSPDPVLLHQGGIITFVNPAALIFFGAAREEDLVGTPVLERIHPDFRRQASARAKHAVEHGDALPLVEEQLLRLDGSTVDAEVTGGSFRLNGQSAMQMIVRDITGRKAQQKRLTALLAQTEEDARTKTELLREVNHRVTNNLSAVLGLMAFESRFATADPDWTRAALDRLSQRIRGLLHVHRMLSQSAWSPVSVHELAGHIIRAALNVAPWRGAAQVVIPAGDYKVSPRQAGTLAMVINELATNTVKHAGPAAGATPKIEFRVECDPVGLRVNYRDNGPGFPTPVLDGRQSNVGLRLINELVTKTLGGTVTLANADGAVTTFSIKSEEEYRT